MFNKLRSTTIKNLAGRSVAEMLCVLMVVGLAIMMTVMGLKYSLTKHKVNVIMHDVTTAFFELEEKEKSGDYNISFEPESKKHIMLKRSSFNDGKIYGVVI